MRNDLRSERLASSLIGYRTYVSAAHAGPDAPAREVVLRVDFELVDDEGCIRVSTRFHQRSAVGQPRVGDTVYLLDAGGGGCAAVVESVDGWYVCVRPDWSTWAGSSPPPAIARLRRKA
jgi:hypothetical protein